MSENFKAGRVRGITLSLLAAALLASLTLPASPAAAQKGGAQASSAEEIFSLGFFYYNNSDIRDDNAARQFERVIKSYPGSAEAQKARFFLGSYFQRKYYIQRERYRVDDGGALDEAGDQYQKYIKEYPNDGPCQCLADANFHLAMVFLQQGNKPRARTQLQELYQAARVDPAVYIYQVVWTSNSNDVIDSHFDARRLAEYTDNISGLSFDETVNHLKGWFRDQKSKK